MNQPNGFVHVCPYCKRRFVHDLCPHRGDSNSNSDYPCGECHSDNFYFDGERFVDEFKDWVQKVRRKAGVSNG